MQVHSTDQEFRSPADPHAIGGDGPSKQADIALGKASHLERAVHVTYTTTFDTADAHAWSGSVTGIARALASGGAHLEMLGEIQRRRVLLSKAMGRLLRFASPATARFPGERTVTIARHMAAQISRYLHDHPTDVVFSPGTIPIALLDTRHPKVFYTDATFAGILGLYPEYRAYPQRYVHEGHYLEQEALRTCDLAVYSSQWAARTAMENYDVQPHKIRVIPFGGNVEHELDEPGVVRCINERGGLLELLFIGIDWHRKGGPRALEIVRALNRQGVEARLHVVGCEPQVVDRGPELVIHGFLNRSNAADQERLEHLLRRADLLLLPSVAECYGLVLCEANARGVPAFANDVGGIGEVVKNDLNGRLFPLDAPVADWVASIAELHADRAAYKAMALRAWNEYRTRLNWDRAGRELMRAIREII